MARPNKKRVEVQDLNTGQLTPIQMTYNRVTDTYIRPTQAEPGHPAADPSGLGKAAESLSQFQPKLQSFLMDMEKRDQEAGLAEGAREYINKKDNAEYVQRIKMGELAPGESPYLMRGAQVQYMKDQVEQYRLNVLDALSKNQTLLDPTNPNYAQNYNKFMDDQRKAFFEGTAYKTVQLPDGTEQRYKLFDDRDVERVLLPGMHNVENQAGQQHSARMAAIRTKYVEEKAGNAIYTILKANEERLLLGDRIDYSDVGKMINDVFYNPDVGLVKLGFNPTAANNMIIDLVAQKAVEEHDDRYLNVLSMISTQDGKAFLGDTRHAKATIEMAKTKNLEYYHKMEEYRRGDQRWSEHNIDRKWELLQRERTQKMQERTDRLNMKADSEEMMKLKVQQSESIWLTATDASIEGASWEIALGSPQVKMAKEYIKWADPQLYRSLIEYERKRKDHAQTDRYDTDEAKDANIAIIKQMTDNPRGFHTSMIWNAAANGLIDPKTADKYAGQWRSIRDNTEHPYLQNPAWKKLMGDADRAIIQNKLSDQKVLLEAMNAKFDMMNSASEWLEKHPQATQEEFEKFAQSLSNAKVALTNQDIKDTVVSESAARSLEKKGVENPKEKPVEDTRGVWDKIMGKPSPQKKAEADYQEKKSQEQQDKNVQIEAYVHPKSRESIDKAIQGYVDGSLDHAQLRARLKELYEPTLYAMGAPAKDMDEFIKAKIREATEAKYKKKYPKK